MFNRTERTSVFIDGSSLYYASKNLGFEIDFQKLRNILAQNKNMIRVYYYVAIPENQEYSPIMPLVDWLSYNGFSVITKPAREFTDNTGRNRIKGDTTVEIAVDMLEKSSHLESIILISGDSNLRRAVEAVQNKGLRVYVISTQKGQSSVISDDLRRQADEFLELDKIREDIEKTYNKRTETLSDD